MNWTCVALMLICFCSPAYSQSNWDYPKSVGQSGVFKINDKAIAAHYSKQSDDSFREVVAWYSERTGTKALLERIDGYISRDEAAADVQTGSTSHTSNTNNTITTAVYAFSPTHMHVTFNVSKDDGTIMSLSVAGNDTSTTINWIRQFGDAKTQLTKP